MKISSELSTKIMMNRGLITLDHFRLYKNPVIFFIPTFLFADPELAETTLGIASISTRINSGISLVSRSSPVKIKFLPNFKEWDGHIVVPKHRDLSQHNNSIDAGFSS